MNPDVVWVELGLGKAKHEALGSFLFLIFFFDTEIVNDTEALEVKRRWQG